MLACGGTRLAANGSGIAAETVWNDDPASSAGGGGVSDVFDVPDYQRGIATPSVGKPRRPARTGVPDVAGNADPQTGYQVRVDGQDMVIGGTSAVAPLWAGLIALLEQESCTVADAVAADPAGSYAAAAAQVIDAFAGLDELDAMFALPEFGPGATFPGSMAIGFHFVDYVVHGWDVARTMGHPFELPPDVVAAVLPIALAVPDAEFRVADSAPFGPSIQARDQSNDLDRILAYLGRSPKWAPTGSGLTRRN